MSDELLPYYNRELSYIRRLATHFARTHPKIAARLRLQADASQDPHVERLLEGFAYLTARVRHKLDDDFPEITEGLLEILYPHYRNPIPSMAIVQFELDEGQNEMTAGATIARGMQIETEPISGEPCKFRTCYPVPLWPIELESAVLSGPPFKAPLIGPVSQAASLLRLRFKCNSAKIKFSQMTSMRSLRFFLHGQDQHMFPLYELILNNTMAVAVAEGPDDPNAVLLDKSVLRPVGFEKDEGLLPYGPRSLMGYRLLTEFFVFVQKFLFLEITNLQKATSKLGNRMELFFYLDQHKEELEKNVSTETFRTSCTPIVNLYPKRAEPISMTETETEYRIVPDSRRPLHHEIYTVDRVLAGAPEDEPVDFTPFFSIKHSSEGKAGQTFGYTHRRPAEQSDEEGVQDLGTEVYLSMVDLVFERETHPDWTIAVETTCLNRDLPSQLPFGEDQPRLQFSEGGALVSRIRCLTAPTKTLRPAMKRGTYWRLLSHLSLNHLSIVEEGTQAEGLREILKLYDFIDSDETRKIINGIVKVQSRRVTSRIGRGAAAFCRGLEVTIDLDPTNFSGSGLYLFASVLERFLGLYCTINSFTQLVAREKGNEEELHRWPPRAGDRVLA